MGWKGDTLRDFTKVKLSFKILSVMGNLWMNCGGKYKILLLWKWVSRLKNILIYRLYINVLYWANWEDGIRNLELPQSCSELKELPALDKLLRYIICCGLLLPYLQKKFPTVRWWFCREESEAYLYPYYNTNHLHYPLPWDVSF